MELNHEDSRNLLQTLRLIPDATLPSRAHAHDAGLDLYCNKDVSLEPGAGAVLETGIAVALPEGSVGLVADRSSLAKKGLKCAGGVIDAGYRGEIRIVLWNLSAEAVHLKKGERVAQLLIFPVLLLNPVEVVKLDDSVRGSRGFGSTGK
ncbi:dUTP diphosphatase [Bdellovibrionota bacterium FG-2]